MTNRERVSQDINKLIINIKKNADQKFKQEIRQHSMRILSSYLGNIGYNSNQSPSIWKERIQNKVAQNFDNRSALQCQEACDRFINSSAISKKSQVLRMLFKLSQSVSKIGENFDSVFLQKISHKKPEANLSQTMATSKISTMLNNNNYSHITNQSKQSQALKMVRYRGAKNLGITESSILKQITFRLQNIKSQLIITDNDGFSALKPTIDVPDTVKRIVRELSQIGWLYSKITQPTEQGGAVAKALKLAIKQEMSEYYRWLAIIENMIKQDELTLRKLILWSYQPFEKLKWMAIVLQAAKPFQGCQIISIINSYRPQGSNSINQLLNRLLTHLLQPLFQYIYNWVYRGQLTDPHNEFFIKTSKKNTKQWQDWKQRFQIQQAKIPNVLDYESAIQIYKTGKTLYFLKNHCKIDYHLQVPFFDVKTALNNKINQSTTILSPDFKAWLKFISNSLNKQLVRVMFDKFALSHHLHAIKMFYLTGKGDFIQKLMDSFHKFLSQPKHQIHQYEMGAYITQAINDSFTNHKGKIRYNAKQQITDRLLAKKIEYGPDGWDVFNFDYAIQDPINTVISPTMIYSYQKIFHFLWKVKRIQQNLKQSWINAAKEFHGVRLPVLHQCHLLRQAMSHFINNLYGYLMISIQSVWNNFIEQVQKADSLDVILEHHEKVIQEIIQITLNNTKSKHASACLGNIFDVILKFASVQERLKNNFSQYYENKRVYNNRKNLIHQGVQFSQELQPPYFNGQGLGLQIRQIKDAYQKAFDRFYGQIKKDSESRVSALCFRLDFSGYYSEIQYNI